MRPVTASPRHDSDQPELVFSRFAVEVLSGDEVGKRVVSEGPELQIGTALSNEMVLTDSTVSRHHCVIAATDEGFLLTDLDSMNGVKLGGYRVRDAFLKDKSTLKLGRVKLGFSRVDGEVREKLSITPELAGMVGDSATMRRLFARCRRVAPSTRAILLEAEPGTGKRAMAEGIHLTSGRATEPFVAVDVSTLAISEVDDAIFGERGAIGRAGAGTLYIASVGELPPELQERLADTVDECRARLIAGTHRDLRPSVNRGRFRADLYHRLAAIRMHIPPLRDRPVDVAPLARHMFRELFPDAAAPSDELIDSFTKRQWWGNARALRDAIAREAAADI